MLWITIPFFLLLVVVIVTNIQIVMEYRKTKEMNVSKPYPLKKWNLISSTLGALYGMALIIKDWIVGG
jgi:uncharacterized metal-binding protein